MYVIYERDHPEPRTLGVGGGGGIGGYAKSVQVRIRGGGNGEGEGGLGLLLEAYVRFPIFVIKIDLAQLFKKQQPTFVDHHPVQVIVKLLFNFFSIINQFLKIFIEVLGAFPMRLQSLFSRLDSSQQTSLYVSEVSSLSQEKKLAYPRTGREGEGLRRKRTCA